MPTPSIRSIDATLSAMVALAGAPQERAPQRDGEIPGTSTPRAPGVACRRRVGMAQAYFVRDKMAVIYCLPS